MRRIACFVGTCLNVCLMTVLFSGLLIASNVVITKSFAHESATIPQAQLMGVSQILKSSDLVASDLRSPAIEREPSYCSNLAEFTCSGESYASRKRSIFEYSGRCLREEMGKNPKDETSPTFEAEYAAYISSVEKKILDSDRVRLERFFDEMKKNLITSVNAEKNLSGAKKKEYAARVEKVKLLWPSEHVKIGGSREFRNTCGEFGLEENASYAVFASGATYVVVCPGRIVAALKDSVGCDQPKLDLSSMIYTLSHELGHSIGGNFMEFDKKNGVWVKKEDQSYGNFQTCMKGKYNEYPQKDYGEAAADYWASQSMALYFKAHPETRESTVKKTMAGLCGTSLTHRHLPGDVRIRDLIGTQANLRASLGCTNASASDKTCAL